jgi:hypothetical protein
LARSKINSRKNITLIFTITNFVSFDPNRILRQLKIIELYINRSIISIILPIQPNLSTTFYIIIRHEMITTEFFINKLENVN